MKPAPLQLIDYWATSLKMDACPGYNPGAETHLNFESIKVDHRVVPMEMEDDSAGMQWLVGLSIEQAPCEEANIPYTFAVTIQGIVLALPGVDKDRMERAVQANGPAMLFGSAREMIRAATGRGPHPAVIIPSTNFISSATPAPVAKPAKKKTAAKKATRKKS
jgi:preprotein translocase subunit SecB